MSISDEQLQFYIDHADMVGENGTPPISTGQIAEIARELLALRHQTPTLTSLQEALTEWLAARSAFVGLEPKGGKEALNRLSEAENALADVARALA